MSHIIVKLLIIILAGCSVKEPEVSKPQNIIKGGKRFVEFLLEIGDDIRKGMWDKFVNDVDKLVTRADIEINNMRGQIKLFGNGIESKIFEDELTDAGNLIAAKNKILDLDNQYKNILSDMENDINELDNLIKNISEENKGQFLKSKLEAEQKKISDRIKLMEKNKTDLKLARLDLIDKKIPVLRQDIAVNFNNHLVEGDIIAAGRFFKEENDFLKNSESILEEINKREEVLEDMKNPTDDETNEWLKLSQFIEKRQNYINAPNNQDNIEELKGIVDAVGVDIDSAKSVSKRFVADTLGERVNKVNFTDELYDNLLFRKGFIDIDQKIEIVEKGKIIRKQFKHIISETEPMKEFMNDIIKKVSITKIKGKFMKTTRKTFDNSKEEDELVEYVYGRSNNNYLFKIVSDSEGNDYTDTFFKDNPNAEERYPGNYSHIVAEVKPTTGTARAYVCITGSQIIFHSIKIYQQATKNSDQTRDIEEVDEYCKNKKAA